MESVENVEVISARAIVIRSRVHPPTPKRVALTCAAMIALALVILLPLASRPRQFVFDEGIYVEGSRSILAHTGIHNPEHPPLGKLLFSAGMALAGVCLFSSLWVQPIWLPMLRPSSAETVAAASETAPA